MGAHYPAMALVEVKRPGRRRGEGRDRDHGGGARIDAATTASSATACRRRSCCRSSASTCPSCNIPSGSTPRRSCSRAARRTPSPSSTIMAAGPMASSTISAAASRGCWSRSTASSPATACSCAGPMATPCSPPGSACSRPAGWSSRPCRCCARARSRRCIDRAEISHAIVDQPLHRRLPRGARSRRARSSIIVKYDGDYGQGELETRTASLEPLPPVDTGRDDPALIAFTSGTTGVPKGCVQFHRDVLAPCDTFAKHIIGLKPGDIALTSAPLAFTFGLGSRRCSRCAPAPPARRSSSRARRRCSRRSRSSASPTSAPRRPPTRRCCRSRRSTTRSRPSATACRPASICPKATWHAWKDRTGIAIIDGIGATEMMHIFISAAGDDIRPGATGKAVPGYEATVLDEDGQPLDEGDGPPRDQGPDRLPLPR